MEKQAFLTRWQNEIRITKLRKDRKGPPFLTYPGISFAHGIVIQHIVTISGVRQISCHHSDGAWPGVLQYFL